ncbi:hypothetical protein [Schleiferilactobacillus shenzhenensis]|nr:hypothetical protein [Schleiferilactobacillus shenzhenensis]
MTKAIREAFPLSRDRPIIKALAVNNILTATDLSAAGLESLARTAGIGPKRMHRALSGLVDYAADQADAETAVLIQEAVVQFFYMTSGLLTTPPFMDAAPHLPTVLVHDQTSVAAVVTGPNSALLVNLLLRLGIRVVSDITPIKLTAIFEGHGFGHVRRLWLMRCLKEHVHTVEKRESMANVSTKAILVLPLFTLNQADTAAWLQRHGTVLYPLERYFGIEDDTALRPLFNDDDRALAALDMRIADYAKSAGGAGPTDSNSWRQALSLFLQTDFGASKAWADKEVHRLEDGQVIWNAGLFQQSDPHTWQDHVADFTNALRPKYRIAFTQRVQEGKTLRAVAETLHLSQARVGQMARLATRKFGFYWRQHQLTMRLLLAAQYEPVNLSTQYSQRFANAVWQELPFHPEGLVPLWFGEPEEMTTETKQRSRD